jgi:hypothetical protein
MMEVKRRGEIIMEEKNVARFGEGLVYLSMNETFTTFNVSILKEQMELGSTDLDSNNVEKVVKFTGKEKLKELRDKLMEVIKDPDLRFSIIASDNEQYVMDFSKCDMRIFSNMITVISYLIERGGGKNYNLTNV